MSPGHEVTLTLDSVGVTYRNPMKFWVKPDRWALRNVSFELRKGESLGIIGKNGAGKSTLVKIMAGIINPDEGKVIRGKGNMMLLSLRVGMMMHLTGRENAIISGLMLGMSRKHITKSLAQVQEYAELGPAFDEPMRTYSAGMRARLGFAVACQASPDILLLDEVLGVGDAGFRQKSTATMEEMIRSDKTIVIVSHQEETLKRLCDRVIWLERGEIREAGQAGQIISDYSGNIENFIGH